MAQISRRLRFEILRRDGYTCRYCGAQAPDVQLEVDHVIPDTLGGSDEPSNLVTACAPCNRGKSSMPADASIVEEVAQDALRWARATEEAARLWRMEHDALDAVRDDFRRRWNALFDPERTGMVVEVPLDWLDSVERFLSLGLTMDDLERIAKSNSRRLGWSYHDVKPDGMWKYFCGSVHRTLATLQEDARRILESEGGNACG